MRIGVPSVNDYLEYTRVGHIRIGLKPTPEYPLKVCLKILGGVSCGQQRSKEGTSKDVGDVEFEDTNRGIKSSGDTGRTRSK